MAAGGGGGWEGGEERSLTYANDTMMERIMACIPPNPRRVGYIDPIHGPLDGPLYMGSHIHQH